jgi:hypothetical protein
LTDRARALNRYRFCEDAVVFHNHPTLKRAEWDKDYLNCFSHETQLHDLNLYRLRKANNWKTPELN